MTASKKGSAKDLIISILSPFKTTLPPIGKPLTEKGSIYLEISRSRLRIISELPSGPPSEALIFNG